MKYLMNLRPVDMLIIVFIHFLSLLSIVFFPGSVENVAIVMTNLIVALLIILLSRQSVSARGNFPGWMFDWYPMPIIFLIFKEVHYTIQATGWNDWDPMLIAADKFIFGADPTVWIYRFATPFVTEILQIAYTSYFFIMLAVGIELYMRSDKTDYLSSVFMIVYGFTLSYLGYLVFPAVGPRFTLHDFASMNAEMPGLWLTNFLRAVINAGESIPENAVNAIVLAQRDVFPSGHAQMTLVSIYLAFGFRLKVRYAVTVFGVLLMISTVYLRYHYVVDILGGTVFAWFTLWSGPKIIRYWNNFKQRK